MCWRGVLRLMLIVTACRNSIEARASAGEGDSLLMGLAPRRAPRLPPLHLARSQDPLQGPPLLQVRARRVGLGQSCRADCMSRKIMWTIVDKCEPGWLTIMYLHQNAMFCSLSSAHR